MTAPPILAENARIAIAQVELRTVTVSRKQMTLAVFRQLPLNPYFVFVATDLERRKLTLRRHLGEVWGWVNYHDRHCPVTTWGDPMVHLDLLVVAPPYHEYFGERPDYDAPETWTLQRAIVLRDEFDRVRELKKDNDQPLYERECYEETEEEWKEMYREFSLRGQLFIAT